MRIIAFVSCALAIACASSPAPQTYYLLRSQQAERAGRIEAPAQVGLGRVTIAPYLDQAGLVVELEAGQVRPAQGHLWAEPLDAGLRSYLRGEISRAVGYDVSAGPADAGSRDYTVSVHVDQLHGTMAGRAVLEASYRITSLRDPAGTAYRFSRMAALPREGYPGLVDAEVGLVRELAEAIAGSLREIVTESARTSRPERSTS